MRGIIPLTLALAICLVADRGARADDQGPTYANPVDIDYRYNWEQINEGVSYRTGADPAIVRHKGAFYMFQTLADGYWRSTDMVHWTFITPSRWTFRSIIAPAVWSDGERLYVMPATTEPTAILVSDAPETGKLDYLTRRMPPLPDAVAPGLEPYAGPGQVPPGPWDPALFKDDDGRWYLYWGSSNRFPLYGIELDPATRLSYVGRPKPMLALDPTSHGWERFGQNHSGGLPDGTPIAPFVEGAWMTKVKGRYYLQYGAPGTEYNAYANGTYIGDSPLGPFTYAPYNPVAYKPGGFMQGAGHGSTFQDNYGNWWNSGTPWVGYNGPFERRIAVFPAHFYDDGQMMVSTRFGDWPHRAAVGAVLDPDSLFAGWMLLSYHKRASASSALDDFTPDHVTDENVRSFWVAGENRPGETLTVDLGGVRTVRAVQVNFADYKAGRFADASDIYTEFTLEASMDGGNWHQIGATDLPRRDRPNAYLELQQPERARYIRYVHGHIGGAYLAIADLRVFGNADGVAPTPVRQLVVSRDCADARNAQITWSAVSGALGYNVRWGIRPDRLTLTWQTFADQGTSLPLRALTKGQEYFVAVEAFNETGVSPLTSVKSLAVSCSQK